MIRTVRREGSGSGCQFSVDGGSVTPGVVEDYEPILSFGEEVAEPYAIRLPLRHVPHRGFVESRRAAQPRRIRPGADPAPTDDRSTSGTGRNANSDARRLVRGALLDQGERWRFENVGPVRRSRGVQDIPEPRLLRDQPLSAGCQYGIIC